MPVERSTGYGVSISRDPRIPGWARVSLRKHFWSVDTGTRSRLVAETGFWTDGMGEPAILTGALRMLADALDDLVQ